MKKLGLSFVMLLAMVITFTSCKNEKSSTETEAVEEVITEEPMAETEMPKEDQATTDTDAVHEETPEGEGAELMDKEDVEIHYSYIQDGKTIEGTKTFKGHQSEVEAAVRALEDSLKKINPNIKIRNLN